MNELIAPVLVGIGTSGLLISVLMLNAHGPTPMPPSAPSSEPTTRATLEPPVARSAPNTSRMRIPGSEAAGSFSIDRTEVTVAAYRACVDEGVCGAPSRGPFCNWGDPGRETHPVNCVDYEQAARYCAWAGARLPSVSEWRSAARDTKPALLPEGDREPPTHDCFARGEVTKGEGVFEHVVSPGLGTCEVSAYPSGASTSGVLGLTGNVAEWTATEDAPGSSRFVTLGVSWADTRWEFDDSLAAARAYAPSFRDALLGFRCASNG